MSEDRVPEAYVLNSPWKARLNSWWKTAKKNPFAFSVGAAITAGLVALVWFIVWMATPREVLTRVEDISWIYTEYLRQREVRHDGGWGHEGTRGHYDEPVFNEKCERRYYGQETYICGSYETTYQCGDRTCRETHYEYCTRPEYRTWCDYDYFEWPVIATKQTSGNTHDTYWDHFTPNGPLQRTQLITSYEVNFVCPDDKFQYKPEYLSDFKRFNPHDKWKLQVGRIRRHNIEKLTKLSGH